MMQTIDAHTLLWFNWGVCVFWILFIGALALAVGDKEVEL